MKKNAKQLFCPGCGAKLPAQKKDIFKLVIKAIRTRPDLTYREIADVYHMNKVTVAMFAREADVCRRKRRT